MTPQDIINLIYHRTLEIDVWVAVRCLAWLAMQITGTLLAVKGAVQKQMIASIGACFLCISWICFEASCGYYIALNGSRASQLENRLEQPEQAHEHKRAKENPLGKISATFGFFIPFLLLFWFARFTLVTLHQETGGGVWARQLTICATLACGYFGWVLFWASKIPK